MDDAAVFFNPDDFAITGYWDTQVSESCKVVGIFQTQHRAVLGGDFGGVSSAAPVFICAADDVPATASQGDSIEINEQAFRVSDLQPDGSGLTHIILERD